MISQEDYMPHGLLFSTEAFAAPVHTAGSDHAEPKATGGGAVHVLGLRT